LHSTIVVFASLLLEGIVIPLSLEIGGATLR